MSFTAQTKASRRKAGLCHDCGRAARVGKTTCAACATAKSVAVKQEYQRRKAAGLCVISSCQNMAGAKSLRCDPCRIRASTFLRANWRRYEYGLTAAEFEARFDEQGRCCAICKATESGGPGQSKWQLDHDHRFEPTDASGHRGILCVKCNMAIGLMRDSSTVAFEAAKYLESHGRKHLRAVAP